MKMTIPERPSAASGRTSVVLLLASLALVACAPAVVAPVAMQKMHPLGEEELQQRFPSYQGGLFRPAGGSEDSPGFGILFSPGEQCDTVLLTGFSNSRAWSYEVPVEREGMDIESVTVKSMHIGSVDDEENPELFTVLKVESRDKKRGIRQSREALYLFRLGERVQLLWYATLRLSADQEHPCGVGGIRYEADVTFQTTDELLTGIRLQGDVVGKRCVGGPTCDKKRTCLGARNQRILQYQWDPNLQGFRGRDDPSAVLMVPDVSY